MACVAALCAVLPARPGAACASCGSASDEPMVLYPNERSKVSVGVARSAGLGYLRPDGRAGAQIGPAARDSLTLAAGLAVGPYGAVTVTVPVLLNEGARAQMVGVGDLFVAARASVLRQRLDAPGSPQLQLIGSFRNAVSPSYYDARRADLLDVFGSGFDEARVGADLWWGMWPLRFGGAVQGGYAFARATPQGQVRPGPSLRGVLTGGVGLGELLAVQASYSVELAGRLQVDAQAVPGSGRVLHALGAGAELTPAPLWAVRLSVGYVGLPGSANAQRAVTCGVAGSRAW